MIHPTAIISPSAKIGKNVKVGAYSIIEEHVSIGNDTVVGPHVVITGHTTIGEGNRFYQFASIGEDNQDKKYKGEPTKTTIGNNNIFRESCTIHRGTVQGIENTIIGDDNLFMAYTHIAHDCIIGNSTVFANNATLAGHVEIDDYVILGGFSAVHQFCRIGIHAFLGIHSIVTQDIPPFVMYAKNAPRSINSEGLKRKGLDSKTISLLLDAYKTIYKKSLTLDAAIAELKTFTDTSGYLKMLIDFISKPGRGIVR